MRHLTRALRLIIQAAPGSTVLFAGLTVLAATLQPTQIWLTRGLIDRLTGGASAPGPHPLAVILLLGVMWFASETSGGLATTLQQLIAFKVTSTTKERLLRQACTLDYALFENPTLLDRLTITTGRADSAAVNGCFALADLLRIGLSLGAVAVLLARLHPLAPVAIFLFSVPKVAWGLAYSRRYFRMVLQETEGHRMAERLARTLTSAEAAKEMRLFSAGGMLLGRYSALTAAFLRETRTLLFGMQGWNALCSLAAAAAVAGVWYWAVAAALAGQASLGDLALYLQAAVACSVGLASVGNSLQMLNDNRLLLAEVFHFLDLSPAEIPGSRALARGPHHAFSLRQGIEFRDVWFTYPGTDRVVLAGVNLAIPAHTTMGLVGRNGCGKTTLVKLLTHLYDPVQGEILLDGIPLAQIPVEEYQNRIGVVFQDFVRYELTLRDNVGIGCPARLADDATVHRAIEKGGAASLLAKMPRGLDTVLSRNYTGGIDLSIGEWQRVAMSRAFAREDAELMVLDEPTAALDVFAEQRIFAGFAELVERRTAVLVSHRLSAVRQLTAIAVMDEGRIVEHGAHKDLMQQGGLYQEMFVLQATQYGLEGGTGSEGTPEPPTST